MNFNKVIGDRNNHIISVNADSPIETLQDELLINIFSYLGLTELNRISCVKKSWHILSFDPMKNLQFSLMQCLVDSIFLTIADQYPDEKNQLTSLMNATKIQLSSLKIGSINEIRFYGLELYGKILKIIDNKVIKEVKIPEAVKQLLKISPLQDEEDILEQVIFGECEILAQKNMEEAVDFFLNEKSNHPTINFPPVFHTFLLTSQQFDKVIAFANFYQFLIIPVATRITKEGHIHLILKWAATKDDVNEQKDILIGMSKAVVLMNKIDFDHILEILSSLPNQTLKELAFLAMNNELASIFEEAASEEAKELFKNYKELANSIKVKSSMNKVDFKRIFQMIYVICNNEELQIFTREVAFSILNNEEISIFNLKSFETNNSFKSLIFKLKFSDFDNKFEDIRNLISFSDTWPLNLKENLHHLSFLQLVQDHRVAQALISAGNLLDEETKYQKLLEYGSRNSCPKNKKIEMAKIIPDPIFEKNSVTKEIFFNPIIKPEGIIELVQANKFDELLDIIDTVPLEIYTEIGSTHPQILFTMVLKLKLKHRDKAVEIANAIPNPILRDLFRKQI